MPKHTGNGAQPPRTSSAKSQKPPPEPTSSRAQKAHEPPHKSLTTGAERGDNGSKPDATHVEKAMGDDVKASIYQRLRSIATDPEASPRDVIAAAAQLRRLDADTAEATDAPSKLSRDQLEALAHSIAARYGVSH